MAETDAFGVLRKNREHHFRRRAEAELVGPMVFDSPPTPEAKFVRKSRLLDRIPKDLSLELGTRGHSRHSRPLQLRKDIQNHRVTSLPQLYPREGRKVERGLQKRDRGLGAYFPRTEAISMSISPDDTKKTAQADDWAVESLFHFVVNATNFERSLEFYQRLGFRVLRENRDVIWPSYVGDNFGMEAAQGRGSLLGLGESEHHTRLDLIEWLEPRWENPDDPPSPKRVPRIMALRTRNLRAAYKDLQSQGVEFIATPRDPDAQTGVESVVCCRDPDGYIVELIEYMGDRLGSNVDDLATRSEGEA